MQTLTGHTSPETAYLVMDYPYGFRLRCQIRYWLEHKRGYGFRLVSQTSNPKKPGLVWNKPKAGTYGVCLVMVTNDDGHVTTDSLQSGGWDNEDRIAAFAQQHGAALTPEHVNAIRYIRATIAANDRITWTVRTATADEPAERPEDQAALVHEVVKQEYIRLTHAERKSPSNGDE